MDNAVTKEQLAEMLVMMDQDGDGMVTEPEFKTVLQLLKPEYKDEEKFKKLWHQIDADESGHLDQDELASYFGYKLSDLDSHMKDHKANSQLTDAQILETLQMHQALRDMELESRKKLGGKDVKTKRGGRNSRDLEGIETIKMPTRITDGVLDPKIEFMLACNSGDEADVKNAIAGGINVRLVDENGEMPLHKLCRCGLKDCVKLVLDASKKVSPAARMTDLNMQEKKKGWSPIFFAANFGHKELLMKMVEWGADLQLEDDHHQNIMHTMCSPGEKKSELCKEFLSHEKVMPCKSKLLATIDKDGHTPLHKAAYLSDEHVVGTLLNHGAKKDTEDNSKNTPAQLAGRAGRKKSRELLEIPGI